MRFILGFIFFGLFFYGMSVYFPDAFATLVSWAAATFGYLRELGEGLAEKVRGSGVSHAPTPAEPIKGFMMPVLLGYFFSRC